MGISPLRRARVWMRMHGIPTRAHSIILVFYRTNYLSNTCVLTALTGAVASPRTSRPCVTADDTRAVTANGGAVTHMYGLVRTSPHTRALNHSTILYMYARRVHAWSRPRVTAGWV